MKNPSADIEKLVIEAHPGAQVTYEIVQQLVKELPLRSAEDLTECLGSRGLKVGGATASVRDIVGLLPSNVFPVNNTKDLVVKVAAAVRIGANILTRANRYPDNPVHAGLLATLGRESQGEATVSAGYFGGPSLFGGKKAKATNKRKGA